MSGICIYVKNKIIGYIKCTNTTRHMDIRRMADREAPVQCSVVVQYHYQLHSNSRSYHIVFVFFIIAVDRGAFVREHRRTQWSCFSEHIVLIFFFCYSFWCRWVSARINESYHIIIIICYYLQQNFQRTNTLFMHVQHPTNKYI